MRRGYYPYGQCTSKKDTRNYNEGVPLGEQEKVNFDAQKHGLNVERRIFEREGMFNLDTKNNDSSYYFKNMENGQPSQNSYGEITGENFDVSELDQGMPMRDFMVNDKGLLHKNEKKNDYLDFDLYDQRPDMNSVSYHDPNSNDINASNQMYSNFKERSTLLNPLERKDPLMELSSSFNRLSLHIFNGIKESTNNKHRIVMSPLNFFFTWIMLYIGSSNETTDKIQSYFELPSKDICYKLSSELKQVISSCTSILEHNIVYIPCPATSSINQAYQKYVSNLGVVDKLDLRNCNIETNRVSDIIQKLTHGVVKDIVPQGSFGPYTGIVTLNSFILKVKWKIPFHHNNTNNQPFYSYDKKIVQMMQQTDTIHRYGEDDKNQILEMDMLNDMAFGIVLPKDVSLPSLTYDQYNSYVNTLNEICINRVCIPKFKYRCRHRIDSVLKKLGSDDVFTNATFDNICPNTNGVNVTDMIHNCIVSVDEGKLSEYGQHVEQNSNRQSKSNKVISVDANRPFAFYIRHVKSNCLITIGMYI